MEDEWFTVSEIAAKLKVTEQTVRRWLRAGALPGRNFGGKAGYRVRGSDLAAFLARRPEGEAAA